ncbi:MAG: hypothetical protein GX600_10920 [Dehalococcoidia bacterium]|nr:hypothetical protein [Dehalococcoidia bacterium]
MNTRRMMLALYSAMILLPVLSGCSSGSMPTTPTADVPTETTPPSGVVEPGGSQPAEEPQASVPASAASGEPEATPPTHSEEESAPPANDDGRIIGPSTGPYTERNGDGVDLLYFETTNACACMIEVGDAVESAVLTDFQTELRSGELRFYMLFSNSPENMDLVKSLGAQPFDLFIGPFKDGQGRLEPDYGIWSLTGNNEAIEELVRNLVLDSLKEQR